MVALNRKQVRLVRESIDRDPNRKEIARLNRYRACTKCGAPRSYHACVRCDRPAVA